MMNLITNESASALSNDDKSHIILGVDHGYGNIKTASCCFRTSVDQYETRPDFARHVLEYNDHFYVIGEGHKEYRSDKMKDDDHYLLTLAAIARELNLRHVTDAAVFVAAGLPLTWLGSQKETFRQYLLRNDDARFRFAGKDYTVRFTDADVFPQGFADKTSEALFQQIENLIEQNTKVLLEALQGKETMTRVIPDAASDNKHERTEQDQQTALDFLDGF